MSRTRDLGHRGHRRDPAGRRLADLIAAACAAAAQRPPRRRRRARRHPEDRVEGRGPARAPSTPTTRCRTRPSSRPRRCGSCAAAATSSSPRPSTASCAPTPASTSRTSQRGEAALLPDRLRPLGPAHPRRPARPPRRRGRRHRVGHLRAAVAPRPHRRRHRRGRHRRRRRPAGHRRRPRPRVMQVTEVAVADELASAAELVMGKSSGIPVAIVRGVDAEWLRDADVGELVRPPPGGPVQVAARRMRARCRPPASSTAPSRGGCGPARVDTAKRPTSPRPATAPAWPRRRRPTRRCSSPDRGLGAGADVDDAGRVPRDAARTKASTASST